MSAHFEVIYETGNMSVVDASNRDDAIAGIRAHHERAQKGQPAYLGPIAVGERRLPAERIVKVFEYDRHPHDLSAVTAMASDSAKSHVTALLKKHTVEGVTDLQALAGEVLPMPLVDAEAHDSKYRADGKDVTKEVIS